MTVKDFLETVREQNKTVTRIEEQQERTQAAMIWLSSPALGDKVQSNHQGDISDALIRLEERRTLLAKELQRLLDMKAAAEALIALEEDSTARDILTYYYVEGLEWARIAEKMNYTDTRWIMRKRETAIANLERAKQMLKMK